MDNLEKTIRKLYETSSANFDTMISQMKSRAKDGKIQGVTEAMIDDICYRVLNEDTQNDRLPKDILDIFLEAEEAVKSYDILNEELEFVDADKKLYETLDSIEEKIDSNCLLESFLGGINETI